MNNKNWGNFLKWIIKIGIFSTLFTQFFVYSGFFFPYIFTKTIFFRIVIEIIFFAYLLLATINAEYKFKSSRISWAIFAYISILLLTSMTGVNFMRSFWGTVERSEGIITILHLIGLYIISISIFKEKKDWLTLFDIAFFTGVMHAGYGLLQKLNIKSFLGIFAVLNAGERVQGTIGNASFFAGIMLMTVFIGLLLYLQKKNIKWRIFYTLGILFCLYIMIATQNRGSVLGLLSSVILFGLLNIFFSQNKKLKTVSISVIITILLGGVTIWFCRNQQWIKNYPILRKLTEISSQDITTQSRLLGWQGAIKGWTESPKTFLLGYGYENYNIPFNKYFNPKIFIDEGSQLWFDRAHNIILDVALTSGLIGLVAYLAIYIFILQKLYLSYKSNRENIYLYMTITCGLVAYFIQNLFVFDTLPIYILLYLIFAYVVYLTESPKETLEVKKKYNEINSIGVIITICVLGISTYLINVRPAIANNIINEAFYYVHYGGEASNNYDRLETQFNQYLQTSGKTAAELTKVKDEWQKRSNDSYDKSVELFEEAISYGTYQNREFQEKYIEAVLTFYNRKSVYKDKIEKYFEKLLPHIETNIIKYPKDVQEYLYALAACNIIDANSNIEKTDTIIELSNKSLELSPTRPQIYFEIAKAYVEEKKYDEAIANFQKAVDLNPNNLESRWYLFSAYIKAHQDENADKELSIMVDLGYDLRRIRNVKKLIDVYIEEKNYAKLAPLYDTLIEIQSLTADHYIKAAIVNREIGEYQKTRELIKRAIEIDPSLELEAEAFLKTLE